MLWGMRFIYFQNDTHLPDEKLDEFQKKEINIVTFVAYNW